MMHKVRLIDMNHVLLIGLLSILILFAGQGHAEIYKWKDAEGNVQYTQHPPPVGADSEKLNISSGTVTPTPPPAAEEPADDTGKQKGATQEPQTKELTAEQKAEIERKCNSIRTRLQSLQRPRVSTVDEEGNRVRLTEEERQAQIKEATSLLEEHCN